MKKVSYLMLVVLLTAGCATGYYAPHNVNQFGTQTQVVLGQANFRVVRHLEVVIDINNTNLKRADVEKSAYAELLRRANLTGSQALINVVIEEVRRESSNVFRVLFSGIPKVTQHVAARATIIEFLDETGNPIKSPTWTNEGTAPREETLVQNPTETNEGTAPREEALVQNPTEAAQTESLVEKQPQPAADEFFIAWIYKTGKLTNDENLIAELKEKYDYNKITRKAPQYTATDLKKWSEGHNLSLEKYVR